jgi:peptide/nickel transport system ATP-binding protein
MIAGVDQRPGQPLLSVRGLTKHFPLAGGLLGRSTGSVRAVDDVSFSVRAGETLGIVGESGCGKSTTSRLIMALLQPTAGAVLFDGQPVAPAAGGLPLRDYRRQVQMVFQDSYASLNPRLTVGESIAFAPQVHGMARRPAAARAAELLAAVGLEPGQYARRTARAGSGSG